MKDLLMNKKFQVPIVMFLIGLLLMITADIMFPAAESDTGNENTNIDNVAASSNTPNVVSNNDLEADKQRLEGQIKSFIESISGIKSASVVITYDNSGELYTQKDTDTVTKDTTENDSAGGERSIKENSSNEDTVYVEGSDGSKYPFVVSEKYAEIRGVAVSLKGTYDDSVREKIVRTLEVLLDVPTHKIQVIW